jgi:hypothetical protein
MLDSIKQWVSEHATSAPWADVGRFAQRQKMVFKRRPDDVGFCIENRQNDLLWRLDFGPPQRQYIQGFELSMRMRLSVGTDLQMMVLSKNLFETLENLAFECFTETTQTIIESTTPEEMRWLVIFPSVAYVAHESVQAQFQLVGSSPLEAAYWMEGSLAQTLRSKRLDDPNPFMLMVLGDRIYLRMQLEEANELAIRQAVMIFEVAAAQAVQTAVLAASPS